MVSSFYVAVVPAAAADVLLWKIARKLLAQQ
jgi:hypothetical protein